MALKMLLVRVDLAGIGFGLGVTEETVLAWLKRAAQQAEAITPLLRPLPVTQVQLDEMWNVIARTRARETDEASASRPEGEEGRQGHMRQEKVKRMSCRVLAPSPSGRGDRRCALCDKHLELNLAPMPGIPPAGGRSHLPARGGRQEIRCGDAWKTFSGNRLGTRHVRDSLLHRCPTRKKCMIRHTPSPSTTCSRAASTRSCDMRYREAAG